MTHPIGVGTVNVSLNLLRAERMLLGKLAAERDESLGHFIRELAVAELGRRDPATAREMVEHRRLRRATALGVLGIWAVLAAGMPDSGIDLRRAPASASVRGVRRTEEAA